MVKPAQPPVRTSAFKQHVYPWACVPLKQVLGCIGQWLS